MRNNKKHKAVLSAYTELEKETRRRLSSMAVSDIESLGYNKVYAYKLRQGHKPKHGPGGFKTILEIAQKLDI